MTSLIFRKEFPDAVCSKRKENIVVIPCTRPAKTTAKQPKTLLVFNLKEKTQKP